MRFDRNRRLRDQSLNRLIPNMLTIGALCAGLTAVHFGLQGFWEKAIIAIVVAGILDTLDGRIARLLNGSSKFGAELDSLSDFVSFGVAPALLLYQWTLKDLRGFGWVLALVFAVCCALRLARFNTRIDNADLPAWTGKFFNASLDKASEFNERQAVALRLADGRDLAVVQIAGLVARRIRCDLRQNQTVRTGERFGLIRFGSRVDVYLPDGVPPLVVPGQIAIAGETVIGDLAAMEAARHGEER